MGYEIVMPQLSDSMDEGKLISWKVKEGQKIKAGDVIAEVESDKAIMEVQSFKSGVVAQLRAQEGDVVAVGKVIAVIQTAQTGEIRRQKGVEKRETKAAEHPPKPEPKPAAEKNMEPEARPKTAVTGRLPQDETSGISPKARARAARYGVEAQAIVQNASENVVHEKDVEAYIKERYFTPKALKLLEKYGLDIDAFDLTHKIDEAQLQEFIESHTPPQPLTQMQKAIIANVTASAQKPVYHLYEHIDAALFLEHERHSITTWLIKIFAKVMMAHEAFRTRLKNDRLVVSPSACISVAVADEKNLYMPVVKDANNRSVTEIAQALASFKTKRETGSFRAEDMQGSSFGISNLGMLGVERFDAMINKDDAAIAAIGGLDDGSISVTLTVDHRLINGYEAALFMRDVKQEAKHPLNFKE